MGALMKRNDNFLDSFFSLSVPTFLNKEISKFFQDSLENVGFTSANILNKDIEILKNEEIGGITLSIDLPGISKEDVNIDYEDGFITISGARKEEEKDKLYSSIKYGEFLIKRHVGDVEEDRINAKLENGVLSIDIPLKSSTESEKKKIEIN